MTVKADWLDGDTFAASDENAHAAQTNTNTTDIAARVVGEASSADSEVALFSGTGGKTIKRATGTGIPKLTSGVLGTATAGTDYVAPGGALGTPSSGTLTNATGLPISGLVSSTSTALGVGSIELGHASDTTVARSSAGNISVEGNVVYRAGGTDVPITDGGTGVSTLPSGLLKGAGTSAITAATAGTDYYAPGSTDVAVADGGTGASTASAARTNLGLVIGTDVQAYDADLTTWGGKTAPSGTVVGDTDTQTLTNKRITPRENTVASSATPTINTDTTDVFTITALAANITSMTTNLSGTPTDGQKLMIRIKGDATPRTIAWGASFQSSGVATLLSTTAASKTHHVGLMYDADAAKWVCIAVDATGY